MQSRRSVIIADTKQVQNPETGRMEWKVTSGKQFIAEFEPLGAQTFFTAGGGKNVYSEKISIRKAIFNREQFVYSGGQLYEFVTFQPYIKNGRAEVDMIWLIVRETTNANVVAAIEKWRQENQK